MPGHKHKESLFFFCLYKRKINIILGQSKNYKNICVKINDIISIEGIYICFYGTRNKIVLHFVQFQWTAIKTERLVLISELDMASEILE